MAKGVDGCMEMCAGAGSMAANSAGSAIGGLEAGRGVNSDGAGFGGVELRVEERRVGVEARVGVDELG